MKIVDITILELYQNWTDETFTIDKCELIPYIDERSRFFADGKKIPQQWHVYLCLNKEERKVLKRAPIIFRVIHFGNDLSSHLGQKANFMK